ncbi:MAG TPA: molybdopterin dinucleotide binding domain-containing protein [Vicinamibacterales bacterium]|nr:molybdopterin dinucleotide binding domain-containing protein [Vicinamibacterales bacterium]
MASSLNRRDFLTYSGATVAGLTLGEAGRRWLARADERAVDFRPRDGVETFAASVCRECPAGCSLRVRSIDGTPVKIDGNPNCPIARGRLCAKGQASLEAYFDPDRLVGPAKRIGARGENRWAPIAWTDAVALLASHLTTAPAPGAVVAVSADERGPIADAWAAFWTAHHARLAWTIPPTAERFAPAFRALTGTGADPVFDVEHATHVLSFGAPLVEDWLSPVWSQRSYGRFRRGASRQRGRLVQIDERRSMTARKADEWLPVSVDRQATLAYGVASVLLREDRVDRRQLAALASNAAEFESTIVSHYTPDAVALVTGIPVVTLLRLARELVATPQPLVLVNADAPRSLVDAVFALNALVGALDRAGGIFVAPTAPASVPRPDARAALADIAGQPPAVVALRDASALRALDGPADAARLLARCGFVVSFSPYLDEASLSADLLLPTHTPLESWHALTPPAADGTDKLACARPAVAPRLDTHDLVAVLRMTADATGGGGDLPASSEAAVQPAIDRLWSLRRGAPYATTFETNWVRQLERGGWWVAPAASREEFGRAVLDAGGWIDPFVAPGSLRRAIAERGGLTFVPAPAGELDATAPDTAPASLADVRPTPAAGSTLRLVAFTPSTVNLAGSANQPVLFELLGQPDNAPWRVWAEINSETAQRLGIESGAAIRITSSAGSIVAVASRLDRVPANTIAVAYVPTLRQGGRWARQVDADVRMLWEPGAARDPINVHVRVV